MSGVHVRSRTGAIFLPLAALISATATGCRSTNSTTVVISGFAFHPPRVKIHAGQTVTVANDDTVLHGFTADKGAFENHSITAGSTDHVVLTKTGVYSNHCPIHVSMTGVVEVDP